MFGILQRISKKKLLTASKKSSCKILEKWIKSIGNHYWRSCATREGGAQMLQQRWISVLFHIQNKHRQNGHEKFQKCVHPRLTKNQVKAKEWFSKITKSWSSKPIKKEKNRSYQHRMVKENVEYVKKKEHLEKPLIPYLPKNIASILKPDKTVVIKNQRSCFGN